jgi:hypothetical protein
MAAAEPHPSVEELAAFTLGTLGEETQASVEAHVAACTPCQERAAVAPGDTLVELLRSVHARASRGVTTAVDAAEQVPTPVPLAAVAETNGTYFRVTRLAILRFISARGRVSQP